MSVANGVPKSRLQRFGNLFRNVFNRASPEFPPPLSDSHPLEPRTPLLLETPEESQATSSNSRGQNILPPTDQRPVVTQSSSARLVASLELTSHGSTSPPANPSAIETINVRNAAWAGLLAALRNLKSTPGVFGPLASAAGVLLDCFNAVETAARNQKDYEELATELTMLSVSLTQHFKGAGVPVGASKMSKCVSSVAVGIERQTAEIKANVERRERKWLSICRSDEEDLIRHYRRIQALFRQLQSNLNMNTWSIANQLLLNTQLEALNPEKQAAHDSGLSASVSRRTCTEGTRTRVLANLVEWVYDREAPAVYWMDGMAGTGKTTIAYTLSEWLERHELLAGSFFCTQTSVNCRDVTKIIPTIVYQLARYSTLFQSTLSDILNAQPDAGSKNISKQFERLLKEPLENVEELMLDNLVVVIDALDECDDHNGVETILDMLFRYAQDLPLKFFVTSRPEPAIYRKMSLNKRSLAVIHLHDIKKSLVRADIELYLKEELAFMSPSRFDIAQLVDRSGALFIYAATLVRYIQPSKRRTDPHKRLRRILVMTPSTTKEHSQIDALYTAILKSALNEDELEGDEVEDIRVVLRIVLFAQEPISVGTIATLAGVNEPQRVEYALLPLRSVLHQSETTGLVSTLHTSFQDFMFDNKRSGPYFYDFVKYSQLMAQRCFLIMGENLRFNICDLESSFIPNEKVENIQDRIKDKISPWLAYACRHWPNHLKSAPMSGDLLAKLGGFLSCQLLFWMEVLSLRGELVVGIGGLLRTKQWLIRMGYVSTDLVLLVEDAFNFVMGFTASPVSQSTPHIYISSLPFCPRSSLVYKNYLKRMQGLLVLKGTLMERRKMVVLATWNIGLKIRPVAYSPDGSRVAIGCVNGTVSILDAYDGTLLVGPLWGHTHIVQSVAFSPDGRFIASGSDDKTIRVWSVRNGTLIADPFKGHSSGVYSVSFSPDSTRIVSAGFRDKTIRIWNATDGTLLLAPLHGHHDVSVNSVVFSFSGTLIASASSDHTIQLWNAHDGSPAAPPFKGHTDGVNCIAFTPDDARLISGSHDKTICVWNMSNGSLGSSPLMGHTKSIYSVAVSPGGTHVVSGSDDCTVRVWRVDDGSLVAGPFVGHTGIIESVAYSPDGIRVVSASSDKTIRQWNVREGALLPPISPRNAVYAIQSVWFSPDGSRIWSSSKHFGIHAWDIHHDSFINYQHNLEAFPPFLSDFSPDNANVVCASKEGEMQIMNTIDLSLVAGPLGIKRDSISAFRFSPDSTMIIMGHKDGTLQARAIHTRQVSSNAFTGHMGKVTSLALSPDCSLAVSSSDDGTLRAWDVLEPTLNLDSHANHQDSPSDRSRIKVSEGWRITKEGWVINSNKHLLFWVPDDLSHVWPSPHAKFTITGSGTLEIPNQKLFIGEQWSKCYVPE
ncbi:hypothetical protein FRC11_006201 [Ceratobasidium sp. 423]|nr:hypothetical protein FRC11_006201 [Ceratobasidium sp. 423]